MSYASKHLIPDEKLLYETRLSWVVLFWPVIVPSLILLGVGGYLVYHYANADVDNMKEIGVGFIVVAALVFGIGLTKRNATEMAVTNKQLNVFAASHMVVFMGDADRVDPGAPEDVLRASGLPPSLRFKSYGLHHA